MKKLPWWGYIGIVLVLVFWYLNWHLTGLRTHWGFFPLWFGYCLTIDSLVFFRKGTSLLSRNPWKYIMLFVISAPSWWLFELINERTGYWFYTARDHFTDLEYFALASISFSTVIPAVFGTGELIGSLKWIRNLKPFVRIGDKKWHVSFMFILGIIMLIIVVFAPRYGAPFMWMSLYFILDPLNVWLGNRSVLSETGRGDWRTVVALSFGCMICGFFWEMWNYLSYPKWIYEIPGVDFWYLFEMPALGYLGYIPFALELFALYHLIRGIFSKTGNNDYLRVIPAS